MNNAMTTEQQVLLLSSARDSDLNNDILGKKVVGELDWNRIFLDAMNHKVLFILYEKLNRLGLLDVALKEGNLSLLLLNHWKQLYKVNGIKNEIYFQELSKLQKKFSDNHVKCVISKGGPVLINQVYSITERKMYDLDFIASREDIAKISECFYEVGFIHGEYIHSNDELIPSEKSEIRKWLLHTRGIPNFVKKVNSPVIDIVVAQVQFKIGSTIKGGTIDTTKLIEDADVKDGILAVSDEDLLIQLANHIYRETQEEEFADWNMNWNLIKFCDLDRYIHYKFDGNKKRAELIKRIVELGFVNQALYAFYYTDKLFPSSLYKTICNELIEMLPESIEYYAKLKSKDVIQETFLLGNKKHKNNNNWKELMGAKTT